jgi:hypothetical protein
MRFNARTISALRARSAASGAGIFMGVTVGGDSLRR